MISEKGLEHLKNYKYMPGQNSFMGIGNLNRQHDASLLELGSKIHAEMGRSQSDHNHRVYLVSCINYDPNILRSYHEQRSPLLYISDECNCYFPLLNLRCH